VFGALNPPRKDLKDGVLLEWNFIDKFEIGLVKSVG
jgi:hypothetical protein